MIGHLVPIDPLQRLAGWGDVGVVLFFCLSGFLITHILLRAEERSTTRAHLLRAFYARRFLRIFPIYYLTIAVVALVGYEPVRENLLRLLTYSLNLPGLGLSTDLGAASHLWSLSVEEQFYICWPLVLVVAPRRYLKQALTIAILASFTLKLGLALKGADYATIFRPITGSIDSLALGALVAVVRAKQPTHRDVPLVPGWLVAASFTGLVLVTAYRMVNQIDATYSGSLVFAVMQFLSVSIASALAIAYLVDSRARIAQVLSNRALRAIARISYGLYVYHFFMPNLLAAIQDRGWVTFSTSFQQTSAVLVLTFATAIVSWLLIESPLLRLKSRLPYRRSAPATSDRLLTSVPAPPAQVTPSRAPRS